MDNDDLIFPQIDDFPDTEFMEHVEVPETAMDVLVRCEPSLAREIITNWGKRRLHDEIINIFMGNSRKVSSTAASALLEIFNNHSERFKFE